MGKPAQGVPDSAAVAATGSFTASGNGVAVPVGRGDFNLSLWGTFAATITPQRSFDGGATWLPFTYADGSAVSWTGPMSSLLSEPETGVVWRLVCAWTSGTVNWRVSQ